MARELCYKYPNGQRQEEGSPQYWEGSPQYATDN